MKTAPHRRKRLSEASIYRFINRCRKEIKICETSKTYLAGVVLSGAALEYLLNAWIRAFVPRRTGRKRLTGHWSLKDLNDIAHAATLLDDDAFDAAERIRKYRNLVHPNWYAGRKPIRFTKALLDARLTDFNLIADSVQRYL